MRHVTSESDNKALLKLKGWTTVLGGKSESYVQVTSFSISKL